MHAKKQRKTHTKKYTGRFEVHPIYRSEKRKLESCPSHRHKDKTSKESVCKEEHED